ncbi:MAG: hypothetical protein QW194_00360 [Candidatus Micrarchaeaceae archaeon]|jgi:NADH:ubiquinone oxidoreductase subunit 6 (subunit J)
MDLIFFIVAVFEIASVIAVFKLKDILHAAIALASVFFANSIMFLLIDQDLLAILQLFIMIGGVSTYIFVGVASGSFSRFKHTSYIGLAVISVVLAAVLLYPLVALGSSSTVSNALTGSEISADMSSSIQYLYFVAIFIFAVSIGAVIVMKRIGGKK